MYTSIHSYIHVYVYISGKPISRVPGWRTPVHWRRFQLQKYVQDGVSNDNVDLS